MNEPPSIAGQVVRVTLPDGQQELYDVAIAAPGEAEAMVSASINATNEIIEAIEGLPQTALDGLMLPTGSLRKRPPT
jgi:hypothetical protein